LGQRSLNGPRFLQRSVNVIAKKDPSLAKEAVIEHCVTRLTGYKRPRYVEFCDALPNTPIRKVLRRELRDAPKQ
jgi:long-chain acyl-CoA synthetase